MKNEGNYRGKRRKEFLRIRLEAQKLKARLEKFLSRTQEKGLK